MMSSYLPARLRSFILLSLFLVIIIPVTGQNLVAVSPDYTDTIPHDTTAGITDIFYIYHSPDSLSPVYGSLRSELDSGTASFEWRRFDTVSLAFDELLQTDTGAAFSVIDSLGSGAYQVRITGSPGQDTSMRRWVFRNSPGMHVEKDPDGKVPLYQYTCDYLLLKADTVRDDHRYYDFEEGAMRSLPNTLLFEWSSDDTEYEIFGARTLLNLFIYNSPPASRPPVRDTRFTLTLTDSFGIELSDEVLYESIHVRADFSTMIEDEENPDEWIETEDPKGQAPLEVWFINQSENGEEFFWTYIDSAKTGIEALDTTYSPGDTAKYMYYIPNNYYPSMIAMSSAGCLDSLKMTTPVFVEDSELDAPNVFSPNEDGINDVFLVRGKSLKEFRITIYSRWGHLVYEFEQTEDKFEWEGWDGTIKGRGNNYAEPGIYYWVIEAIGWDGEKQWPNFEKRGFVYLYRDRE